MSRSARRAARSHSARSRPAIAIVVMPPLPPSCRCAQSGCHSAAASASRPSANAVMSFARCASTAAAPIDGVHENPRPLRPDDRSAEAVVGRERVVHLVGLLCLVEPRVVVQRACRVVRQAAADHRRVRCPEDVGDLHRHGAQAVLRNNVAGERLRHPPVADLLERRRFLARRSCSGARRSCRSGSPRSAPSCRSPG